MKKIKILPYKKVSQSAKALADALDCKRLRLEGSKWKPTLDTTVINWGNSDQTWDIPIDYLNTPWEVEGVSNKLYFFRQMQTRELTPPFWENSENIPDEAFPIVCRTILNGHSGAGIVIADTRDDLVPCQLYVQYVKKKAEYRIHVGMTGSDTSIIAVQQKVRKEDKEVIDWKVRNLANGFIYKRQDVTPPDMVLDAARASLRASGLDFGAVDVIWNEHAQKAYVLEINTAPGLEGQTIEDYKNYFLSVIGD